MQPDEAYTTEQNLPTPRSASSQCNECFRQQHTFPFPQQNCLLPTGHLGLEQAAQHQPKNHSQAPKGHELLETVVPLRMVVGRAAPPPTNEGFKKKKKSVGRRAETRPGEAAGGKKKKNTKNTKNTHKKNRCFSAVGSSNIPCPHSEPMQSTSFPPGILNGDQKPPFWPAPFISGLHSPIYPLLKPLPL